MVSRHGRERWVYPRVCGGASGRSSCSTAQRGLSPRVRGSLRAVRGTVAATGSIPACAGEPRPKAEMWHRVEVYPACAGEPSAHGTDVL